ncbi:hypothetical protein FNV43_RR08159 [Rhamnella rubrinervis]|uniref:BRX domain-containing protein n=1 Tax=Rhamnella rubrinervis TaxID=2594499 RepID=A0A8K0MNE1_9ROSA|nr:hypothetical protein FNV43_RR08159 [Rhamnella rubrinervis]
MLTCIARSKQLNNGSLPLQEEEDAVAGTPKTKQAIKTLTNQIKDMALKASGVYKNCKPCSGSSNDNRNRNYSESDAASDSARFHTVYRRTGSSNSTPRVWGKEMEARLKALSSGEGTPASVSGRTESVVFMEEDEPKEWVAQVEPGVLITFISLPQGGNDLKRIRFSRELFNKWQAQRWWAENYDKVMELYNVQRFNRQAVPLPTPPRSEDESPKIESARDSPATPPLSKERLPRNFRPMGMGYSSSDSLDQHPMQSRNYYDPGALASTPKLSSISGVKTETSSVDGSVRTSSSRDADRSGELSISNASDMETEWVEQDEPGVYITIRALPGGARELRRVRFSRERFGEMHARLWWEENKARIQEQYLNRTTAPAASRLAALENIVGNLAQSVEQVLKCLPQDAIQRLQDPPTHPKAGAPNTNQVAHSGQAGSNRQDGKAFQGASSHVGGNNREDQNILLEEGSHQEAKRAAVRSILEEAMDEMREKVTNKSAKSKEAKIIPLAGRDETLKDYITRFNKEALRIDGCSDDVEYHDVGGGNVSSNRALKAYSRTARYPPSEYQEVNLTQRPAKEIKVEPYSITFTDADSRGVHHPHDDALVITMNVANCMVRRILVDNGSSVDILYWDAFKQMGIGKEKLDPASAPLFGFAGERVIPEGCITLPVTAGVPPTQATVMVKFLVVNRPSVYNMIIGRPFLNNLRAVTSTYHLVMKFPTEKGTCVVRGDQHEARKCYVNALRGKDKIMQIGDGARIQIQSQGPQARPTELIQENQKVSNEIQKNHKSSFE